MITTQALIDKFRQALSENWGYIWGTAGENWTAAKQKELNCFLPGIRKSYVTLSHWMICAETMFSCPRFFHGKSRSFLRFPRSGVKGRKEEMRMLTHQHALVYCPYIFKYLIH